MKIRFISPMAGVVGVANLPCLPQKGNFVQIGGNHYEVTDVRFRADNGVDVAVSLVVNIPLVFLSF